MLVWAVPKYLSYFLASASVVGVIGGTTRRCTKHIDGTARDVDDKQGQASANILASAERGLAHTCVGWNCPLRAKVGKCGERNVLVLVDGR
jgi:hypothetical protein